MHNRKIVIIFVSIVFAGFFALVADAHALSVKSLRFGRQDSGTRIVLDLDREADFRAGVQDAPPRIVVELPTITGRPAISRSQLPDLVRDVRIEPAPGGRSRLTFVLNGPAAIRTAFLIPASGKDGARLVVDTAPVAQAAFSAQTSRAFGTLPAATAGDTPGSTLPFAGIAKPKLDPIGTPVAPAIGSPTIDLPQVDTPRIPGERPLVMIDPGHGGIDGGATGSGVSEKVVTLSVAKDLRDALEKTGKYRAQLTRERDVFIPLAQRVRIARSKGADLFVSIHADSMPGSTAATGASFYTLSAQASDAQAARLAARENQVDLLAGIQLPSEDKAVAGILIDLTLRETTAQSKRFSSLLAAAFRDAALPTAPTPNRHAGFMVLKAPDIPSVLIELGFLSTPAEAQKLNDSAYRHTLATSIAGAIDTWFKGRKAP